MDNRVVRHQIRSITALLRGRNFPRWIPLTALVLTVFVFIIPSVQSAGTADANEVTATATEKTEILPDPNESSDSTDVAELIGESKKAAKEDDAVSDANEVTATAAEKIEILPDPNESSDSTDVAELIVESKKAAKDDAAISDANEVTATAAEKTAILSDPNGTADKQDSTDITELVIESTTALPRQKFEDEVIMRILRPYLNAKQYLHDKYHMDIAFESATVYQRAAGGRRPREQATNNYTLFGLWHLSEDREDDIGVLGFSFEQRDNITDHSVRDFSREVGSSFRTHGLSTDERSRTALRQLWWRKKIFDNIMTLTAGKIHHPSYYNRNNFAGNARTHFLSNAFSRNPNRLTPQDGLGINATIKPNDKYYISAGFGDARANTKTSGFDTIEDGDFFTAVEIGFTPTFTELGRGNYRFTLWHIDKTDKDIREGYGTALSFDQELKGDLGFFARYGYTEPQVTSIKNFASGGIVLRDSWGKKDSLFGVGVSWDQASDSGEDEYSMEVFQRFQYTSHMQITPSVLVIFDPAQPDKSGPIPVFGIRFRSLF